MKTRRAFIKQSMAVSAGFTGLSFYLSGYKTPKGELMKEVNSWLELPEGFTAKIISKWGDKMDDGFLVPGRADGMAAFDNDGKVIIIRNHENSQSTKEFGPFGKDMSLIRNISPNKFFDYGFGKTPGLGGTTTIVFDESTQKVEKQFLSLIGTNRNCAGGPTPWNTWITCEEDVAKKGDQCETFHGYNFEVPANGEGLIDPIPIKEMGRFNHEAVAVDPKTGIVYQTEDRHDSLIYRFIPNVPGKLQMGGTLQALAIKGQPGFDTRNFDEETIRIGESLEVVWIPLDNINPEEDDLRIRGHQSGAAVFARGEGMWFGNDEVYFACTNGGKNKTGQVFKYKPSPEEAAEGEHQIPGKLTLFAEPNDKEILKYCDNLTVAPWGDVIIVEDTPDSYMRGIRPDGEIYNIARNIGSKSEMAGVCFSPSGKSLFVNIQEEGLTFSITGPWENLRKI